MFGPAVWMRLLLYEFAYLSKIRRLSISHNFDYQFELVDKVLYTKIFGQLPALERLDVLDKSKDVMTIFYLPAITRLAISLRNPDRFYLLMGKPPALNLLTSLHIDGWSATFMPKTLALARNLKALSWSYFPEPASIIHLDFDELITALSYVRHTLERLQFNLAIYSYGESRSWLEESHQLTDLDLPLVSLAGFRSYPLPLKRHIPYNVEVISLSSELLLKRAALWMDGDGNWRDRLDKNVLNILRSLS
ncbi:unnamed protein product [Clonostachys solani]|uniref:Uncharacterized protein n=1 Tax=Clonostachys solani TaxID=160281 RepID=A0A9N9ZHV1_9HYPO|nr:unnamed protein product [Clonostachys solani]